VKPFWGIMTDMVPLFGYRRKSYLLFFGIAGFIMWNLLAFYGIENQELGVGLLMGINISLAFCNVIGEALLVELSGRT
jgi:MFS-type transporter involved in bile tolerance (Atg22 family)